MTVDKLGIRLYDKVANVVSELIANSYDGDAELVNVELPLDRWLAKKRKKKVVDQGFEIIVRDDGHGMERDLMNDTYLLVGSNPRTDPLRGEWSSEKQRPIMGRKGIGKLAPFGICKVIEVWTAGGKQTAEGYQIAHFIMNYDEIYKESDQDYPPKPGAEDGKFSPKRGTVIKLRKFLYRRTPDVDTFHRQVSRIFGKELPDFKIVVKDTVTGKDFVIGRLPVEIEEETKIVVDNRPVKLPDGTKLPVKGFVAYSKKPYKNEEIAGVRIYARGKLVAVTRDFGLQAGFHGEYTIRSYLTGEVEANWLDDRSEDLIHTGRQDIMWESEKGTALKEWGQALLRQLGSKSFGPMRERTAKDFLELSGLERRAEEVYGKTPVAESAKALGRVMGSLADRGNLQDPGYVKDLADLVLTVAPHKALVDNLTKIGEADKSDPLSVVIALLDDARLAEEASMGQIARERVKSIIKLEEMVSAHSPVNELEIQHLLETTPWLIDPEWTILQANKPFENVRSAFAAWYRGKYHVEIKTTSIKSKKRPDFIMLPISGRIEIVEIKKLKHSLQDDEFTRITGYIESMEKFLKENQDYQREFGGVHTTLICDEVGLSRNNTIAFDALERDQRLKRRTWLEVLRATKTAHQEFLDRWDELRRI